MLDYSVAVQKREERPQTWYNGHAENSYSNYSFYIGKNSTPHYSESSGKVKKTKPFLWLWFFKTTCSLLLRLHILNFVSLRLTGFFEVYKMKSYIYMFEALVKLRTHNLYQTVHYQLTIRSSQIASIVPCVNIIY